MPAGRACTSQSSTTSSRSPPWTAPRSARSPARPGRRRATNRWPRPPCPSAGATVAHYHRVTEELYFFTAGRGRMTLGDEEREVARRRLRRHPARAGPRPGQHRRRAARPAVLLRAGVLARGHRPGNRSGFRRVVPRSDAAPPASSVLVVLLAALSRGVVGAGADDRHRRPEARHVHRPALPGQRPAASPAARSRGTRSTSPTQTAELDAWLDARARGARQPAAVLHALEREPAPAADARAPALRVPPLPRALPVGDRLRELERGQPLRRADLPPPRARRGLLAQAARRVPDVPDPRRRGPRHAQHDLVGEGLPARGQGRAALLGHPQLHRRQPAAHDRHAAAARRRSRARCGSPRPAASCRARTAAR